MRQREKPQEKLKSVWKLFSGFIWASLVSSPFTGRNEALNYVPDNKIMEAPVYRESWLLFSILPVCVSSVSLLQHKASA